MRTEICQASQAWWYLLNPHTLQVEALRDTENSFCFLTDQLGSVARFENTEGQRRERLPQALELQVKKFRLHSEGTRLYRGLVHRLESIPLSASETLLSFPPPTCRHSGRHLVLCGSGVFSFCSSSSPSCWLRFSLTQVSSASIPVPRGAFSSLQPAC